MKILINNEKFLDKEKDVKHKDVLTIVSEGSWEDSQKFKKEDGTPNKQFRISLKPANGEAASTILNWANVKLLVTAFGDETKNWMNKEVRAWKTKSEKAKLGYVYMYAPLNWERDDTGEWVMPFGLEAVEKQQNSDVPEINVDDIPF